MLFTCVFSKNPVGECPPVQELDKLRRENRILNDLVRDMEREISRLRCERKEKEHEVGDPSPSLGMTEKADCHGASRLAMTGETDCHGPQTASQ